METSELYDDIITICQNIYNKKTKDYGFSWKVLRPTSLTDQIYIKALRIRSLEQNNNKEIDEDEDSEFIGIINYCIIGLFQLFKEDINNKNSINMYNKYVEIAKKLMIAKNTDYGEAWKNLRITTYTDFILMKIQRIKQIEDNCGITLISEGIDANYLDIINYSIFALILLKEQT